MFNSEFKQTYEDTCKNAFSIFFESASTLSGILIEQDIEIAETILQYNKTLTDILGNNGNIYNDDVKTVMDQCAKDVLSQLVDGIKKTLELITALHKAIDERCYAMLDDNKEIVEKYQPLLKQLDLTKYTYKVPKFSFDKLTNSTMIKNVVIFFDNFFSIGSSGTDADKDALLKLLNRDAKPDEIMTNLKRAILGVPNTVTVADKFLEIASSMICDKSAIETKSFGDDVFEILTQDVPLLLDIRVLEELLKKELSSITSFLNAVLTSENGDPYYESNRTRYYAFRKMILCNATGLIAEIIQERYRLLAERSEIYRKVVLNAYHEGVGTSDAPLTESYVPMEDSLIGLLHTECQVNNPIFE